MRNFSKTIKCSESVNFSESLNKIMFYKSFILKVLHGFHILILYVWLVILKFN